MALGVLAGMSTIGADIAGAAQGEREFHEHAHDEHVVKVIAKDVAFTKNTLRAGTELVIEGYRSRDGTNKAVGRSFLFPDGQRLFLGGSAATVTPGAAPKQ